MTSRQLIAASSVPILMSVLAHGESYGYAIIARVRAVSGGTLCWTEGMLYPVLHRLERRGMVQAEWRAAGGRERKYYRLTPAGREALEAERKEWQRVHGTMQALWTGGANV